MLTSTGFIAHYNIRHCVDQRPAQNQSFDVRQACNSWIVSCLERSFSPVDKSIHKITFVLREKTKVVGYCHLEEENNIVWLGISIIENKIGQGLGNILITHLLNEAKKIKVESINLAVDEDNFKARNLYEKFGFKEIKKSKKVLIYNYKAQ